MSATIVENTHNQHVLPKNFRRAEATMKKEATTPAKIKPSLAEPSMPVSLVELAIELDCNPIFLGIMPDGRPLWACMVKFKPEMCAKILAARNFGNRGLSAKRTEGLAAPMKKGDFPVTPAAVAFDEDCQVLDGQGRLSAVVASGEEVVMLTAFGFDRKAVFPVIDLNKRRIWEDILKIDDSSRTTVRALGRSIISLYTWLKTGDISDNKESVWYRFGISYRDLVNFAAIEGVGDRLQELVRHYRRNTKARRIFKFGSQMTILWAFDRIDPEATALFAEGLINNSMPEDEARWAVPRLFFDKMTTEKLTDVDADSYMVTAFNNFRKNKRIKELRHRKDATFPMIDGISYSFVTLSGKKVLVPDDDRMNFIDWSEEEDEETTEAAEDEGQPSEEAEEVAEDEDYPGSD